MEMILERNGDYQTVEPWHDSIRYHVENIVKDGRLAVTTEGLYKAVGITEVKDRNQHNAERIRNVMKALSSAEHLLSYNALVLTPSGRTPTPLRFCGCSCWASDHRLQHAAEGHQPTAA